MDHRGQEALAHDAGHERAGQPFGAGGFVVGEARPVPVGGFHEAGHVGEASVRVENRQRVAELNVRDALDSHCSGRSRTTLLVSAEARSWPSGSNISMRLTKNTMRPDRPVLV